MRMISLHCTSSLGQRHRIEHAQVVALSDIGRFKRIGIIPSMQADPRHLGHEHG
jgi:predicted amidohydrolase YtcJ